MTFILIILIGAILSGIVSLFFSSEMLVGLYDVVFNSGITMQTITGVEFFGLIMPISYGVGISLIILKFLKKAFDIYVLWTDGDPDADPFLLLTNFVRAVGTALIFQWLYGLFVDIFRDITNTIILVNDKSMTAEPVGYFTLAYSKRFAPVMNCNASNIISSGFCTISKHFYIPFIIVIVDMFTVICQICI